MWFTFIHDWTVTWFTVRDEWSRVANRFIRSNNVQSDFQKWLINSLSLGVAFCLFPIPRLHRFLYDSLEDLWHPSKNQLLYQMNGFLQTSTSASLSGRYFIHEMADVDWKNSGTDELLLQLLKQANTDYQAFVQTYEAEFERRKVKLDRVSAAGPERQKVHPVLEKILTVALEMVEEVNPNLKNYYKLVREEPLEGIVSNNGLNRVKPNFSIHISSLYNEDHPSLYSCAFPVECKQFSEVGKGATQSIGCALEALRIRMELSGDVDGEYIGYTIASDGHLLKLSIVQVLERKITVDNYCVMYPQVLPNSLQHLNETPLRNLRGFVTILLLLSYPSVYGFRKIDKCPFSDRITYHDLLGTGAFSTVTKAVMNRQAYALKLPSVTSRVQYKEKVEQIINEKRILNSLLKIKDPQIDKYIPHIENHPITDAKPAFLFKEVGIPMLVYLERYQSNTANRLLFGQNLEETLKHVCLVVYQRTGLTHRDIRPTNIVMVKRERVINGIVEFYYTPMLIDWGLANSKNYPYCFSNLSVDFAANAIFRAQQTWNIIGRNDSAVISYLPGYDLEAIEFTVTAICHKLFRLDPPWNPGNDSIAANAVLEIRGRMRDERFQNIRSAEE